MREVRKSGGREEGVREERDGRVKLEVRQVSPLPSPSPPFPSSTPFFCGSRSPSFPPSLSPLTLPPRSPSPSLPSLAPLLLPPLAERERAHARGSVRFDQGHVALAHAAVVVRHGAGAPDRACTAGGAAGAAARERARTTTLGAERRDEVGSRGPPRAAAREQRRAAPGRARPRRAQARAPASSPPSPRCPTFPLPRPPHSPFAIGPKAPAARRRASSLRGDLRL